MNCEVLTAEQPVALAVLGFFASKTYFAGTVVSRVVGPLPVPPHLVELWTFAPEKRRRGWPGLDEDGGGGAVAETESGARWPCGLERWLALATGRCGSGSNPTAENFASELWQFRLPRFGRSVPSIWCLCQGK